MPNRIDRNALSGDRLRRNMQRLVNGAITSTIPAGTYLAGNTTLGTTAPVAGGGNLSTGLTISMPQASSTANGWLSSTDWITFNNKGSGTVTSVGLALPSTLFNISGSPVTTSGTLTGTFVTVASTLVFAGPTSGAAAAPTFRALTSTDIPALSSTQLPNDVAYIDKAQTFTLAQTISNHDGTSLTVTPSVSTGGIIGLAVGPSSNGGSTANLTAMLGVQIKNTFLGSTLTSTAAITTAATIQRGTVTTLYGIQINTPTNLATITNAYGLYVAPHVSTGTTLNYNIFSAGSTAQNWFEGPVHVGSTFSFITPFSTNAYSVQVIENAITVGMTGQVFVNSTDSATLSNITGATAFGVSTSLPANFLSVGKTVKVLAAGQITTTSTQQVTVDLRVQNLGVQMPNFPVGAGTSTLNWQIELITVCRATGSTGTTCHQTFQGVIQPSGSSTGAVFSVGNQTVAIDTTSSSAIVCDFAATVAANSSFLRHLQVEVSN